jgi:hypothetical protein
MHYCVEKDPIPKAILIARITHISIEEVLDCLAVLERIGFVERSPGMDSISAYIRAMGKQALRGTDTIPISLPGVAVRASTPGGCHIIRGQGCASGDFKGLATIRGPRR